MKKWLLGLALAGGVGIAAYLRKKSKRKSAVENHLQAMEFGKTFLRTISFTTPTGLTNMTQLIPSEGIWIDRYMGMVGGEGFIFDTVIETSESREIDAKGQKIYLLQWRRAIVKVFIPADDPDPDSQTFARIRNLLHQAESKGSDSQPS